MVPSLFVYRLEKWKNVAAVITHCRQTSRVALAKFFHGQPRCRQLTCISLQLKWLPSELNSTHVCRRVLGSASRNSTQSRKRYLHHHVIFRHPLITASLRRHGFQQGSGTTIAAIHDLSEVLFRFVYKCLLSLYRVKASTSRQVKRLGMAFSSMHEAKLLFSAPGRH